MHIQTIEQLRALYDSPSERVIRKELHSIDRHIEDFIRLSPFLVIASGNSQMQLDASPRGGDPGWVRVVGADLKLTTLKNGGAAEKLD